MEYAINGHAVQKMSNLAHPIGKTKESLDSDIHLDNHYKQLLQLKEKLQSVDNMLCAIRKLDMIVKSYVKENKTMNDLLCHLKQIKTHDAIIQSFQNMFALFDEEDDSDEENVILSVFNLILEKTKNNHENLLIQIEQEKYEIQKLEQGIQYIERDQLYDQKLALFKPQKKKSLTLTMAERHKNVAILEQQFKFKLSNSRLCSRQYDLDSIRKIQKWWKNHSKSSREIISIDSPQHLTNKKNIHDLMAKVYKYVTRSRTATIVNISNIGKEIVQLSDSIEKTKKLQIIEQLNQEEKSIKQLDLVDGVADCSAQAYLLYYFIINSPDLSVNLKNNCYVFNFTGAENHTAVIIFEPYSKSISNIKKKVDQGINPYNMQGEDLSDAIIIDPWLKFVNFNDVPATDKTVGFVGPVESYLAWVSAHKDGRYITKDKHDLAILSKDFTTTLARSVINSIKMDA